MLVPLSNLPYPAIAHPEATHGIVENGRELCTHSSRICVALK